MKNFDVIVQQKPNFCLCSILQAIFKENGLIFSQEDIAKKLTPAKRGFILNDSRIEKFMSEIGFDYSYFNSYETPFNEPDMLLKEMCENYGILGINSHAYLLEDFHDPILKLINPEDNKTIEMNIYELLKKMRKTNGFFGLIKKI